MTLATGRGRPELWFGVVFLVGAALLLTWLFGHSPGRPPRIESPAIAPSPVDSSAFVAPPRETATVIAPPSVVSSHAAEDSDASALDLRRVYDENADSADPRRRRMAARAFDACFPLFAPSAGETPSPEPMISGLAGPGRSDRENAYRTLFARCRRIVDEPPANLAAMRAQVRSDAAAQEPAARARDALLAGRVDEASARVAEALNSADPATLSALSGLAERFVRSRAEPQDAAAIARARAVDAALPAVACALSLDCGAASLQALQLCALQGLCQGDVAARMQARYGPGALDETAVAEERTRLLALVQSGRTLTFDDLLPQQIGR